MRQLLQRFARAQWIAGVVFVAVLALAALWNLEGGELKEWDEGLTARHAQNALRFDRWLLPTDNHGNFSRKFTKPPLLIWQTAAGLAAFGHSGFGLRVGTGLALLSTGLVAWRLASGMGLSRAVAMSWGALIVLCGGALTWGRVVTIELTLVFFSLGALLFHARAHAASPRSWRWALGSGLCLLLAFGTKQLVAGLAALPIGALELWHLRPGLWRKALLRLSLAAGPPIAGALLWGSFTHRATAGRALESMVEFTVVRRLEGFRNGQHVAALNRLHGFVVEAVSPFDWELAALGLLLLVLGNSRARRSPGLWLVLGYLLSALVLFEGVTGSLLPWYAWSIVVPLFLGLGYVLGEGLSQGAAVLQRLARGGAAAGPFELRDTGLCALAAAELLLATSRLLQPWASRLTVIFALLVAFTLAVAGARRLSTPRARAVLLGAAAALPAVALVFGLGARDGYWRDPGPLLALMGPVHRSGARQVAVAASLAGHENRHRALFGPGAAPVQKAPWQSRGSSFDAYVEPRQLPAELVPSAGVQLFRSAGVVAWQGPLQHDPAPPAALLAPLERGPLTFEAEEGTSEVANSISRARGQLGRRARDLDRVHYRPRPRTLLSISGPELPPGRYLISVPVLAECSSVHRGSVGGFGVSIGRARATRKIGCRKPGLQELRVTLDVDRNGPLRAKVDYRAGDLWVDHVRVSRVVR